MTVHGSLSLIPANTDNHVIDVIVQKQPQENPACLLLRQPPQNAFFPSISVCKAKATENCSVMRREHYMFVLDFNNAMGFAEVPCYSHRTDWDCATGGIFFFFHPCCPSRCSVPQSDLYFFPLSYLAASVLPVIARTSHTSQETELSWLYEETSFCPKTPISSLCLALFRG